MTRSSTTACDISRGGATVAAIMAALNPTVSVVVPTRNRPAQVVPCAESILKNSDALEVIFVDQSDDSQTADALATLHDPRLRCVRSELRGVTNGRNLGIDLSKGEIVAFTDDDCRAHPDWVASLARIFATDPTAAVVCGRVIVPDELKDQGFVTGFEPQVREWKGRYPPPDSDWGITANLALRRSIITQVGRFDPLLGAGGILRSGGEPDFLFRVLRDGMKVVNASEVQVEHLGVRGHGGDSARLLKNYAAGTAAAFLKYVRLGDLDGATIYLKHLAGCGHLILTNIAHLHRPVGFGYTLAFLSGSVASLRYPLDKKERLYRTS